MYVQRNNEERPGNHRCNGKAISITHSEYAFVALGTQDAMRLRCTVFFHITP